MSKLTVKIAKDVVSNTKGVELMSLLTLEAIIQVALLKYREALEEQIGEEELPFRFCTCCGKIMQKGYFINESWAYYCTEDCLKQSFTEKEILDFEIGEEGSENYWTSWL
jgi:hypothetical protein